jgi:two-component system chemotaxis sensor kinase CheA
MSAKGKTDFSLFLDDYLNDAREGFQAISSALLTLEKEHGQTDRLDEVFRILHTLKSSSTMLEFSDIAELAHTGEDFLDRLRKRELPVTQETIALLFRIVDTLEAMVREPNADFGIRIAELKSEIRNPQSEIEDTTFRNPQSAIEKIQTVRVRVDVLDSLFDLVGELIIAKNRIDNLAADAASKELKAALVAMDRIIGELQEDVSAARLVPVDEIFQKFPRMVRDMAREQHKEVELVLEGHEIELDKSILDAIGEPLIHLLRNAVAHGIELPDDRQRQKKGGIGTVKLVAQRAENRIVIYVEDDGAGIDMPRMRQVAVRKGFARPEEVESLRDRDILNLLFEPGFSGAEQVTGLSGRGVGLDVVRTSTKKVGGTVDIATQRGQGTRFTLKLPLTTAIVQTLMVGVGDHVFAIPSDIVSETLELHPGDIREIRNEEALVLRKEVIPFVRLNEVLNVPSQEHQENPIAVVVHSGGQFVGLGVDSVLDHTESIVKPFDPIARQFKGFSGGTILGDGRVALMLDIPALVGFEALREERYA